MQNAIELPSEVPAMRLARRVSAFSHALLPLYIFELRFRQMLEHALQHHRMFCVALVKPASQSLANQR